VPHEEEDTCTREIRRARQQKERKESKSKRGERGSFFFVYFSLLLGDAAGAENAIVL